MRTNSASSYKELLRSGKWFHALPEEIQDAFLAKATVVHLERGQRLFSQGDAPSGLYGVVDGALRMTTKGPDGTEVLFAVIERPQWIGEIGVFDQKPRSHGATAEGDACTVHVSQRALDSWLREEPRVWQFLGVLLSTRTRLLLGAMAEVSTMSLGARIAHRLVVIAQGYGDLRIGTSRVLEVKQEELATMVWASRQTANRCLKDLEAKALIKVSYGEIEILDLDGLRREAETTCD